MFARERLGGRFLSARRQGGREGGGGRGPFITGPCFRGRLWLSRGCPNPIVSPPSRSRDSSWRPWKLCAMIASPVPAWSRKRINPQEETDTGSRSRARRRRRRRSRRALAACTALRSRARSATRFGATASRVSPQGRGKSRHHDPERRGGRRAARALVG
jgi:hypothetical protein